MAEQQTVMIEPAVALSIAERQIAFDKNEKLLLSQEIFELREIVHSQLARITELENQITTLQEAGK